MNDAPNREGALKFVQLLLAPDGPGQAALKQVGPQPIAPIVSQEDFAQLPPELQTLIKPCDPLTI